MKLGIDIGSTTIKMVILDASDQTIFSRYERHFSNIKESLLSLFNEVLEVTEGVDISVMITGSGGMSISSLLDVPFIQEVIAVSNTVKEVAEDTEVAIEIGGEDAKIIYLNGSPEQRMNGICAGGTGSFIDQMASLLQTDASGLNEMAKQYDMIYPIASRCGVFAKSDVQPLINEGAKKNDLAVSIFQAVVNQTISGLACGRPIRGKVLFLGGPLYFLSELRNRFIDTLNLTDENIVTSENLHLFAAFGAALNADASKLHSPQVLINRLQQNRSMESEINRLEPLFRDQEQLDDFLERHQNANVDTQNLSKYAGDVFIGIDAGSTTTKLVALGESAELLYSSYSSNNGNPLNSILKSLKEIYKIMPNDAVIKKSCVTGYGEGLAQAAFKVDIGEIETIAHYKAASFFEPDVDLVLDIGGQDMKCIHIRDGAIDNILLNEACSAGCGSFIETFAKSLNISIEEFAQNTLLAKHPIDLGSRCTVFMNSRVKQAQKEGAPVSDISAGLAYSVIKNALQKVMKMSERDMIGKKIVVQGGTFYNNAVLRSFEIISKAQAIRPNISGIMGAFGAALIARERTTPDDTISTLIGKNDLKKLRINSSMTRCKACTNNCLLTINKFSADRTFISGNRCERGLGKQNNLHTIPNLLEYKYNRLFSYKPLENAPRGTVGLPRALNMYEHYPFWFTFFTNLGYKVVLSDSSSKKLYEKGMESIPSESVCYPAKFVHGHIMDLIAKDVDFIFYPSVVYDRKEFADADNHFNCPIVTSYPENIRNNIEEVKSVLFKNPFLNLEDQASLLSRLVEEFPNIDLSLIETSLDKAWNEQEKFWKDVRRKGEEALRYIKRKDMQAIVLAGRPYHVDPEIHHGIPNLINSYNVAVLTEDSISHLAKIQRPLIMRDQWVYHSRLYAAATYVSTSDKLELVQLNSFGCGLDAVSAEEVQDILSSSGKLYTVLKIDEVNNLGVARIRIRSLLAAVSERKRIEKPHVPNAGRIVFTKEMKNTHTIISPQMSPIHFRLLRRAFIASGYNFVVPPENDGSYVNTGLKYVNNDACYPAIMVVGQLIDALQSGKYDIHNTSVMISQTGGGCRATNYIGFIRRALKKAGLGHVPVISFSASGVEKNPGFKLTPPLMHKLIQACLYGDLLMRVLHRMRPYEKVPGSANSLYKKWNKICMNALEKGSFSDFKVITSKIVDSFDRLPIIDVQKPRVGIVGEILLKFHPTANNNIVKLLESEGAEVVMTDLAGFFLYSMYNSTFNEKFLGGKTSTKLANNAAIQTIEYYRKPMKDALKSSKHFLAPITIQELAKLAEPILSLGNQTGEGWLITADIVELLHSGTNNIICVQPFACLPSHITSKGIMKTMRERFESSNIVAVDYDPGASEVNQVNRIKLMLSIAMKNLHLQELPVEHSHKPKLGIGKSWSLPAAINLFGRHKLE